VRVTILTAACFSRLALSKHQLAIIFVEVPNNSTHTVELPGTMNSG